MLDRKLAKLEKTRLGTNEETQDSLQAPHKKVQKCINDEKLAKMERKILSAIKKSEYTKESEAVCGNETGVAFTIPHEPEEDGKVMNNVLYLRIVYIYIIVLRISYLLTDEAVI